MQPPFGFDNVAEQAERLAEKPFEVPGNRAPEFLLDLSYDQWRDIRFKPEESLWRAENLPFEIQFFHLGAFYGLPVDIHVIDGNRVEKYPFSTALFDYGQNHLSKERLKGVGFAGFRIHYNINRPDYKDEVAVFLGASYFRAVGRNMQYGLSARGLAIDTGLESGEEFPRFSKFWLVKPEPLDTQLLVYALLESESFTGAYTFVIRPGEQTVMSVSCLLYQRKPVKKLGIAPLTSMFFYGENTNIRPVDNFRPEVHDSDGLLMAMSSGEWIWQPLQNPGVLSTSIFKASNPSGFGLMQRDLTFDHYQDLESNYHKRPSAWVKPTYGDWGGGHVELVLIPTDEEVNDNIVAYWVPDDPNGQKVLSFSYDIQWLMPDGSPHGGGVVDATYTIRNKKEKTRTFLVDFKDGRIEELDDEAFPNEVVSVTGDLSIIEQRVERNPYINGWRMVIKLKVDDQSTLEKMLTEKSQSINVRAYLRMEKDALTETWSYSFFP